MLAGFTMLVHFFFIPDPFGAAAEQPQPLSDAGLFCVFMTIIIYGPRYLLRSVCRLLVPGGGFYQSTLVIHLFVRCGHSCLLLKGLYVHLKLDFAPISLYHIHRIDIFMIYFAHILFTGCLIVFMPHYLPYDYS